MAWQHDRPLGGAQRHNARPLSEIDNLTIIEAELLLRSTRAQGTCTPPARQEKRMSNSSSAGASAAFDVGFGLMVTAPRRVATTAATASKACLMGDLLACAVITWMKELSAAAVVLFDCTIICKQTLLPRDPASGVVVPKNCGELPSDVTDVHTRFAYVPPRWMASYVTPEHNATQSSRRGHRQSASLALFPRCFWGLLRAHDGTESLTHNFAKAAVCTHIRSRH